MTNKKVFQKKLEALEKYHLTNPDYSEEVKTSEKGNHYITTNQSKAIRTYNSYNITKSVVDKLGTNFTFPANQRVIMLTQTGKFIVKEESGWKNLTKNYGKLYYIGKKFEWILQYPELKYFRIAKQFSSLNSFKKWLEYEFISDDEFISLLNDKFNIELLIEFKLKSKDERVNLINLLKIGETQTVKDTLNMMEQLDIKHEIPKGKNALKELHDSLSRQIKVKNTPFIEVKVTLEDFHIPWDYKVIQTSYELIERGIENKHCIGSYYNSLFNDIFLVIEGYDCHVRKNYENKWYISQMRGTYNKDAPQEMRNIISKSLEKIKVNIVTVSNIPVTKEVFNFDDTPF